jgi:hypothetical protein
MHNTGIGRQDTRSCMARFSNVSSEKWLIHDFVQQTNHRFRRSSPIDDSQCQLSGMFTTKQEKPQMRRNKQFLE